MPAAFLAQLKQLIHQHGGSVRAVARAAGIPQGTLSVIIAGKRPLPPRLIIPLGKALGLEGKSLHAFIVAALDPGRFGDLHNYVAGCRPTGKS